ncbi:TRAP transporter small permease subunit [Telmatospirillum sp. J64-1]|uniref:TRAP transporter small permease subunit n=1 Tax=Telmatospirillum sp. J64-1 TaxID=2502183 RepID=UPI00115F72D8|nr:TRAP transporter small permease [Telmatospirillum sp. J64-1]
MPENPLSRRLTPVARFLSLLAGYGILALSVLIGAEVLLRRFFNVSLQGADEYGGYALAILAAFGFSLTLLERGHTRIEIVIGRLGQGGRALLNWLSALSMAAMAAFAAWRAVTTLLESIDYGSLSGTPLMTPLWVPQLFWAGGMLFFALVAGLLAVQASWLLAADRRSLNAWHGIKTLSEEIEEEQQTLGLRGEVLR